MKIKKGTTIFLKIAVILIGIIVLTLCVFWLPSLASNTAEQFPAFRHLQYPILVGLYSTAIPFYFALYQAIKILNYIEIHHAFSKASVISLRYIKYCAVVISILYVIGALYLMSQHAFHPGVALIAFTIIFASIVVSVFAAVLQQLLSSALAIKTENDLTV
ncbi:DUF2975 domain-containing protein [Virgibacillus salarius]